MPNQTNWIDRRRISAALFTGAVGAAGVAVALIALNPGADHSEASAATVAVNDAGTKTAPEPSQTFRNGDCDPVEAADSADLDPWSVSLPAQDLTLNLQASGDLTLPAAPEGIFYTGSTPLSGEQGHSVVAGHVDYAPGVLSDQGGELSPWGQLHKTKPCDVVQAADGEGEVTTFQVTDLYTVPKDELEASGAFSTTGDHDLLLVTCSGPSVQDAGAEFQFTYAHNLVVEAVEVEA